jgi:predicted GTPase
MLSRENSFSAEAAALADSLHRTAGLLGRLSEHCRPGDHGGTQLNAECQKLLGAAGSLVQHRVKVAVVGDFDAGKSTLISALAGRQLLPMHPNPATALVT